MPFDNTTGLVEAAPDLSKPTLEGLSWLLRHKEAWPPTHVWDFHQEASCAIGIARGHWGYDAIRRIPGCTVLAMVRLFSQLQYLPVQDKDVTPEMVADRIDAYLRR